jgi:inhibitor of KinA sporulation pathway (predicted exonuclease)
MKYYTVIDLEWTSWKKNYYGKNLEKEKRKKWQKKEIIQIGAIKFDKNYAIKDKLNLIIKPKINKKLSKHIIELTSITNKLIDKRGINFLDGFKKLKRFSKKTFLFSNGDDGKILKLNLYYNDYINGAIKVVNIKKILEKKYKIPKNYLHSPKLKTYFGYKYIKKKAHNALYDCQSIIFAMKKMNFDLNIVEK